MSSEFIPLSVPHLEGNEWAYLKECVDTGWVSSVGSFVDRFERELAARIGAPGAVACSSGTAALHVALLLAGVRAGDEVVVPTLTFIASANSVAYVNAHPVFVDANATFQLDLDKLEAFLTRGCAWDGGELRNKATRRRVAALMPVHVLGDVCDMDRLNDLARRFSLPVIEDATEALGSRYKGRCAGMLADAGCFSFNGNKLITTGNGGMIVSTRTDWLARAKYLTTQAKDDPLEFVHGAIGFNYRLSNISAAMGVAQLERLDSYLERKRQIARRYDEALGAVPGIQIPQHASFCEPNRWLYTLRIDEARFGKSSRALLAALRVERIESRPLWQPMHRSPAHAGAFSWECTLADRLNAECLSIPCSVGLTHDDQERVIAAILAAR